MGTGFDIWAHFIEENGYFTSIQKHLFLFGYKLKDRIAIIGAFYALNSMRKLGEHYFVSLLAPIIIFMFFSGACIFGSAFISAEAFLQGIINLDSYGYLAALTTVVSLIGMLTGGNWLRGNESKYFI